jgi:hypothetical protein
MLLLPSSTKYVVLGETHILYTVRTQISNKLYVKANNQLRLAKRDTNEKKLWGFSPPANYTDRATAACR